jgi:hypothetical protein
MLTLIFKTQRLQPFKDINTYLSLCDLRLEDRLLGYEQVPRKVGPSM